MNYEVTNENYLPIVKETERLIYELAMIVEELRITSQASEDITSKHEQLRDISKMVASWENKNTAILNEPRMIKEALVP